MPFHALACEGHCLIQHMYRTFIQLQLYDAMAKSFDAHGTLSTFDIIYTRILDLEYSTMCIVRWRCLTQALPGGTQRSLRRSQRWRTPN